MRLSILFDVSCPLHSLTINFFQLFMDSYYTSPQLIYALAKDKVWCCGSLKLAGRSHVPKEIMVGDAIDKKKRQRGSCLFRYCNTNTISLINYMDKKAVFLMWSIKNIGDEFQCIQRKEKTEKGCYQTVTMQRPHIVQYYNQFMRGVDVA